MTLAPGIYTDIPADVYHQDCCDTPSLSASIAHILCEQSPAHAYAAHPRLGGYRRPSTKEMDAGTLLHSLLLGESDRLVVVNENDWRKKVAKEARASTIKDGNVPVLRKDYDAAQALADRLRARFRDLGFDLSQGDSEVTLVWTERADDGTEVLCRGRVDHLFEHMILDLKSTASASAESIAASMVRYGYDTQFAAYTSALDQLDPRWAGRIDFTFLFFETQRPFAVTPAAPDGSMRELGRAKWKRAVGTWAHCLRTGVWPEYTTERILVPAPIWALRREMLHDDDAA